MVDCPNLCLNRDLNLDLAKYINYMDIFVSAHQLHFRVGWWIYWGGQIFSYLGG